MKDSRFGPPGNSLPRKTWLRLAAVSLLAQGCAVTGGGSGVFPSDLVGGARVCSAPAASPSDGQTVAAQMQVSNEGGWCGITASRSGSPYASYLIAIRPSHGRVFAHRVGNTTRLDYTPDPGFAGTDTFAVRLIPGNAVIQGVVNVTR